MPRGQGVVTLMTLWGREKPSRALPAASHVQFFLLRAMEVLFWAWLGGTGCPPGHGGVQQSPGAMLHPSSALPDASFGSVRSDAHSSVSTVPPGCHLPGLGHAALPTFCCLLRGHSTQGGEGAPQWLCPHRCQGASMPRWRQGHGGCARLPCDAAPQLLRSYKEMPEPGAEPGADLCRLSITH